MEYLVMRNPSIMQQIKGLKLSYVQEKFDISLVILIYDVLSPHSKLVP